MGYNNLVILMYHTAFYNIATQCNVYFMSFLTAFKKSWHCFSSCLRCLLTLYHFRIIFTKWNICPQLKLFLSYFYPNDWFLQHVNRCSIQELKFYNQINVGKGGVKYTQVNRFFLQGFSEPSVCSQWMEQFTGHYFSNTYLTPPEVLLSEV